MYLINTSLVWKIARVIMNDSYATWIKISNLEYSMLQKISVIKLKDRQLPHCRSNYKIKYQNVERDKINTDNVTLNSVCREIVSALKIVSYDKVRGRNKAQRWLRSVCVKFFITNITQPDTISQDIIMSYTNTHIHDYSLSRLGTDTSIQSDGVKLVL